MESNSHILTNQHKLLTIAAATLLCFIAIALARPYFDGVNSAVNLWTVSIQTESLTEAAKIVDFFDTKILLALSVPFAGLLLWKGKAQNACLLVGAMGLNALLLQASKTLIDSPRPVNSLLVDMDNSFPSGHLTSIIVFVGMFTFLALQNRKIISKFFIAAVAPALIGIMAFDRHYLNAHWFSDVLAAPFLALFVIAVSILVVEEFFRWFNKRHNKYKPIHSVNKEVPPISVVTLYGSAIHKSVNSSLFNCWTERINGYA